MIEKLHRNRITLRKSENCILDAFFAKNTRFLNKSNPLDKSLSDDESEKMSSSARL